MYAYSKGAIREAVHAKLEAVKQSVKSGKKASGASFRDTLKAQIKTTETGHKPVTSVNKNNGNISASGSALIYAMQNSDDTTAAAVLNNLGYTKYSSGGKNLVRSAADELKASAASLKTVIESGSAETRAIALSKFVEDFNDLSSRLAASGSTSGYIYRTSLNSYATEEALKGTGLAMSDKGTLLITGGEIDAEKLSPLITGAMTVAQNVSTYANTISGTNDGSGSIADDQSALGTYYSTLMNLM